MASQIGTSVLKSAAGTSSATQAFTVPSGGSNRALVVQVNSWNNSSVPITVVTYGGTPLTKISQQAANNGTDFLVSEAWILLNPTTGSSLNVVASTGGGVLATFYVEVSAWQDVLQSTPTVFNGAGVCGGVGSQISPFGAGNLATAAGDVVIGTWGGFANNAFTITPTGTTLNELEQGSTTDSVEFWFNTAAGTSTAAATATSTSLEQYCLFAFVLATAATTATLSLPTPSGTLTSETTATVGATTDQASGTFYAVVDSAANLSGVTAAQIKAGQKAAGTAALAAGNASVTTTTPSVSVTGLTAGTAYSYAVVQNNGTDSNVATGTFTTNLFTSVFDGVVFDSVVFDTGAGGAAELHRAA